MYYRFFDLTTKHTDPADLENHSIEQVKDIFLSSIEEKSDDLESEEYESILQNFVKLTAAVESVPQFIESFREIDRENDPNAYRLATAMIVDCLKYNIKDAPEKSVMKRMLERLKKLRAGEIDDIEGLVNKMWPE